MPLRKTPLVVDQIYHVYNRSVAEQPIFRNKREHNIFIKAIEYYRFSKPPVRLSRYLNLNKQTGSDLLESLYEKNNCLADIYSFCLMPNHYHILLKQTAENGISNFIRLLQNSYAKYLNIKTKRAGSLFQCPFKAVRIETDEQFIHVARYIHLNPLTSYILKDFEDLESYEWCSYTDYSSDSTRRFINTQFLMSLFKNKESFRQFTKDNLNYQRELQKIKHLSID